MACEPKNSSAAPIPIKMPTMIRNFAAFAILHNGENSTVDKDNDKPPVIALREIADETIAVNDLRESLIKSNQKFLETEVEEEVLKTTDDNTENGDLSKDIPESDIKSEEISEETNTDINLKEDKTDKIEENSVSDNI